jgi:hypothetical protein
MEAFRKLETEKMESKCIRPKLDTKWWEAADAGGVDTNFTN